MYRADVLYCTRVTNFLPRYLLNIYPPPNSKFLVVLIVQLHSVAASFSKVGGVDGDYSEMTSQT